MGTDVSWKEFFRDEERYADVINGIGCKGLQVVGKDDLQEADTQTVMGRLYSWKPRISDGVLLSRGMSGKGFLNRKKMYQTGIRDMVRKAAFGVNFAIIGIENQELVDYSLPLRCMVYDAGEYEKQAGKIRKILRKHSKGLTAGEYLYGFAKNSKLYPVITFVLYGGKEKWDGPTALHDMLDFTGLPKELRDMVVDYPIHLVEIREFKDTSVFKTDVKQVFDLVRCSGSKEALRKLVQNDKAFQSMEEDAYEVATNYIKAEELIQVKNEYRREDGKIDMCQALKELLEDERIEGRAEGRAIGHAEGHEAGSAERLRRVVVKMVDLGMTDEEIQRIAECDSELILEIRKELGKVS